MPLHQHIYQISKHLVRYRAFSYAVTLTGLLLFIVFVSTQTRATSQRQTQPSLAETKIDFAILAEGSEAFGYPEQQGHVISTEETWTAAWNALHLATIPRPPLPKVDFTQHVVLVIFAGKKPGSGYMILVKAIEKANGAVTVYVTEQRAAPNQEPDPQPTYPFQIVTIPRPDLPVLFRFQEYGNGTQS